jgi:hypothetical protein
MRRFLALVVPLVVVLALPATAAADLSITPSTVSVVDGTTVTFNATADANSTLTWSFDDGTTASGVTVTHTFTGVGQHVVTVTESGASSGTATITVTVTAAPAPQTQWTSSPYPGTPVGGPPPGFKFPLMVIARAKSSRMRANRVAILPGCSLSAKGNCHGTIVLRSWNPIRDRPGHKARVVELGRKAFNVTPAAQASVAVPLSRRAVALIKKRGSLKAMAVVTARDDAGSTGEDTLKLTLTR